MDQVEQGQRQEFNPHIATDHLQMTYRFFENTCLKKKKRKKTHVTGHKGTGQMQR